MLQFTVLNGKVVVDPTILMRPEFKAILDYGKQKGKEERANQMLLYVFHCCDLTKANPIADTDFRMKEDQAERMAFGNKPKKFTKKEKDLVDAAMDAYNFCNEGSLERAAMAFDQKMDEIRTLLEQVKPELHPVHEEHMCDYCRSLHDEGQNVVMEIDKYVSNASELDKFSKMLNNMSDYKLKAMETAKKIENTGRVRGDKGSSLIERGSFRKKVESRED